VADGLVGPDGTPHAAMRELAWVHRPVAVEWANASRGVVRIRNRQWFTGLDWLRATWELAIDGVVRQRGRLDPPIVRPGAARTIEVPFDRSVVPDGAEAHLTVRFSTAAELPWAPRGHEVAWDQLVVARRRSVPVARPTVGAAWRHTRGGIVAAAGRVRVSIGARTGTVDQVTLDDTPLLAGGVRAELWRAPTDNDGIKLWSSQEGKALGKWQAWGLGALARRLVALDVADDTVSAVHELVGTDDVTAHHMQTVRVADGAVWFDDELTVPGGWSDVARVGVSFLTRPGFERVDWFGLGPDENETDRQAGSLVGRYSAPLDELAYVMPQDFGTRTDVRWFAVASPSIGLRVARTDGALLAACSATHHTAADLAAATDWLNLRRRRETVVHADVAKRGVGTASCGPDTLARYRVAPGVWRWSWSLTPFVPRRPGTGRR
jgi:beta-galactosidase